MTAHTLTDTETALRKVLLDTLIDRPLRIHVDAEALSDTAWEYLQAANHAHGVVRMRCESRPGVDRMNAADPISRDQWQVAIRTLTSLLALQMTKPGAIRIEVLPDHLRRAADEQGCQGNYGAARLLDRWAHLVTHPGDEWD